MEPRNTQNTNSTKWENKFHETNCVCLISNFSGCYLFALFHLAQSFLSPFFSFMHEMSNDKKCHSYQRIGSKSQDHKTHRKLSIQIQLHDNCMYCVSHCFFLYQLLNKLKLFRVNRVGTIISQFISRCLQQENSFKVTNPFKYASKVSMPQLWCLESKQNVSSIQVKLCHSIIYGFAKVSCALCEIRLLTICIICYSALAVSFITEREHGVHPLFVVFHSILVGRFDIFFTFLFVENGNICIKT